MRRGADSGFGCAAIPSLTNFADADDRGRILDRRLAQGGLIDRSVPLNFTFNGKACSGFAGDTLASALMASGVDVISRSFKYHRPRGIQQLGCADVGSMVQIEGRSEAPNVLASTTALQDGLCARSVNCWPSVNFDFGAALRLLSPIIPAGFYYKTFMWPHWHVYEPKIRKLAGFGRAPRQSSDDLFETRFWHCDVLIVGAGPAGLMAARAAAQSAARVIVVDEQPAAGGRLRFSTAKIGGLAASDWASQAADWLAAQDNVQILSDAVAWSYLEGNMVCVVERNPNPPEIAMRNWKIWAKQVIIATGAIERGIAFAGNDRPGVMSTDAICSMIRSYAVAPGRQAVLFANNNRAYSALEHLAAAGIQMKALVDVRSQISEQAMEFAHRYVSEIVTSAVVSKASMRRRRVGSVTIAERATGRTRVIECDLLGVSGGWTPSVHLFSQSRGSLAYSDEIASFCPDQPQLATLVAGSVRGVFSLADSISDGARAGLSAIRSLGHASAQIELPQVAESLQCELQIEPLWSTDSGERRSKAFIDFAGDVTTFDLRLALQEGYESIEHLKRYTTTGMGLDQGKTANMNAIGLAAALSGRHPGSVGSTTYRPPYTPVEFGAIAGSRTGDHILPYRHTPLTAWHVAHGAVMFEAGLRWQRPAYYPQHGETMQQAIDRECRSVRNQAGIYDGSPLGKFELAGPDAVRLLNLVYTNRFDNLAAGQGRYGIMLSEDGLIFDDGVTFRLGQNRYLMTCSTGGAHQVEQKLERLIHVDQPDLDVTLVPCTSQWANATVCGPLARDLLRACESSFNFEREDFPFMHLREGIIADMPARIARVSFTGELSFEVNVPSRYGRQLWEYLFEIGQFDKICPVGSEASHVLRVEKGFLSLGHEVDGTVDPIDLGLERLMSKTKADFIGKRAVEIRRRSSIPRYELVGLLPQDQRTAIEEGAPIVPGSHAKSSEGFVSACVWSGACDRVIALGLLQNGKNRHGEVITVQSGKKFVPAQVGSPVFYDPQGHKLRS